MSLSQPRPREFRPPSARRLRSPSSLHQSATPWRWVSYPASPGPPPAPAGFTRKMLSQMDGPMPGYVTLVAEVSIDPGTLVARHTHPGIESGYVVSGGLELPIQGQETRMLKPGDGFQVPVATPHAGAKNGDTR